MDLKASWGLPLSFCNEFLCVLSLCCTFSIVRIELLGMGPALVCRDQHRGHRNTKEGLGAEGLAAVALIPGNFRVEKSMVHKKQYQLCPRETLVILSSLPR